MSMLVVIALPIELNRIFCGLARRVNDDMILRVLIVLVVAELAILSNQSNKSCWIRAKFLK